MNQEKLKLIVRNLELLVQSLKSEVNSNEESYLDYERIKESLEAYNQYAEDGYPD